VESAAIAYSFAVAGGAWERNGLDRLRFGLFLSTGLALPFYAFPPIQTLGRRIDLATILAVLFVAASLPSVPALIRRVEWAWLGTALGVPLLALLPPLPPSFSTSDFLISYAHWVLIAVVFVYALHLEASAVQRRRLVLIDGVMALLVALFEFYQMLGASRGWPGTHVVVLSFQREPLRLGEIGGVVRPTSIFLEPAWLGGYLTWVLVLVVAVMLWRKASSLWEAMVTGAVAAILFSGILMTVSWGAYADVGVGLGALAVAAAFRHRPLEERTARWALGAAAVTLAIVLFSPPGREMAHAVSNRFERLLGTPLTSSMPVSRNVDSSEIRYQGLLHEVHVFQSHPWRGVGLGQYKHHADSLPGPHASLRMIWCGWLGIAATEGILGPLILAGAILLVLRQRGSGGFWESAAVVALVAVAVVQQFHTGSFIDLWWWYPVSVAAVLGCKTA
jgi:hypothetical protein